MNYEELVLDLLADITGLEPQELAENKDINLFESGVLDSLSLSGMIASVEEEIGKTINITDFCIKDFSTINAIVHILEEL